MISMTVIRNIMINLIYKNYLILAKKFFYNFRIMLMFNSKSIQV